MSFPLRSMLRLSACIGRVQRALNRHMLKKQKLRGFQWRQSGVPLPFRHKTPSGFFSKVVCSLWLHPITFHAVDTIQHVFTHNFDIGSNISDGRWWIAHSFQYIIRIRFQLSTQFWRLHSLFLYESLISVNVPFYNNDVIYTQRCSHSFSVGCSKRFVHRVFSRCRGNATEGGEGGLSHENSITGNSALWQRSA